MGRKISLLLLFALLFVLLLPQPAYADAAPPEYPPGSTVGTEAVTNVQMVSEAVSITIEASDETIMGWANFATDHIVGHIDATFNMVNQGSETESLEVWFPLGSPNGYGDVNEAANFVVWVNDEPVTTGRTEVPGEWDYLVPRATWNVTFPPGETVVLRVTYDLYPTGYSPYGEFSYILETGAGWFGSIGQGTVTVTMPYPIHRFNLLQNPGTIGAPNPLDYAIDGNTLTWEFTDLEPTAADNISLTVLEPDRWLQIVDAEANAEANPDSVDAHLELARARVDALSFKYGMNPFGDSAELSELALSDYEHAIALDPQNIDLRLEYLQFLDSLEFSLSSEKDWDAIYLALREAYSIDPGNEQVVEAKGFILSSMEWVLETYPDNADLQAIYDDIRSWSTNPPPTFTPIPPAEEQQVATPVPPTPLPTSTAVPTQIPPSPQPTATPSAAETRRICPGAALLLLVPLGLVWRRRHE